MPSITTQKRAAVLVRREDRLAGCELPPDHVLGEAPQSLAGDPREHLDAGELVDGGKLMVHHR